MVAAPFTAYNILRSVQYHTLSHEGRRDRPDWIDSLSFDIDESLAPNPNTSRSRTTASARPSANPHMLSTQLKLAYAACAVLKGTITATDLPLMSPGNDSIACVRVHQTLVSSRLGLKLSYSACETLAKRKRANRETQTGRSRDAGARRRSRDIREPQERYSQHISQTLAKRRRNTCEPQAKRSRDAPTRSRGALEDS